MRTSPITPHSHLHLLAILYSLSQSNIPLTCNSFLTNFAPHSSSQFPLHTILSYPLLSPTSLQPHQVNWSQRWPGGVLLVKSLHSGQTPLLVQAGMHPHHYRGTDTTHVIMHALMVVCWLARLPKCLTKYTYTRTLYVAVLAIVPCVFQVLHMQCISKLKVRFM